MLLSLAQAYCQHSPLSPGKWRVSRYLMNHVGNQRTVITTRDGFRLNIDTSDFVQRSIYVDAQWEPEICAILRGTLRAGDVFYDIGSNVGYFSLLASRLCGEVHAFEPNPATAEALESNIALNKFGNIKAHYVALSDRTGTAVLHFGGTRNSGQASFRDVGGGSAVVPTVTLDGMNLPRPRLIKMDVEGAEVQVLRGASKTLSGPDRPVVVCEVSEFSLQQLGASKDMLFEIMDGHGYRNQIISHVRRSNATTKSVYFQYDVLFTPYGS